MLAIDPLKLNNIIDNFIINLNIILYYSWFYAIKDLQISKISLILIIL